MKPTSFTIIIRNDIIKGNGKTPVFLRLYLRNKDKRFNLGIEIEPKNWNGREPFIKKTEASSMHKNIIIRNFATKADEIIYRYKKEDRILTFELFEMELFNKGYDTDFFEFVNNKIQAEYKGETQRGYIKQLNKLNRYKNTLTIGEITGTFLNDYKTHLLKIGNIESTANKALKFVKVFINKAIAEDIIETNPFKNIKFQEEKGKKEALNIQEFNELYVYFQKNSELSLKQKETLRAFLFACCTGFRWGDLEKTLKFKNIDSKNCMISFIESKTKKNRNTPIMKEALEFIDFSKKIADEQKVFDLPVNQTANKHLKMIAKEINKTTGKILVTEKITFHYSRRTLDTLIYNQTGSIELAAEIVGHSPTIALKHYAKITDETKRKYLNEIGDLIFKNAIE